MICPACKKDVHPRVEFASSEGQGLHAVNKCPNADCNMALGIAASDDGEPAPKTPADPNAVDFSTIEQPFPIHQQPAPVVLMKAAEPIAPETTTAKQLLTSAAERLAYVEARLTELRELEDEKALLERMLDAGAPASAERTKAS